MGHRIVRIMSNPEDQSAFLDDYFAECDEHLTSIGHILLDAEKHNGRMSAATLQEFFRAAHSIKGLSGMVGLGDAELLAHHMESYLRVLRDTQSPASPSGLRALIRGTRTLEEVIGAKRTGSRPPAIEPAVAALAAIDAAADLAPAAEAPRTRSAATWEVTFVPSSELAAKGIGVDRVRTLLAEAGQIIDASPRVGKDGGISFQFIVEGDLTNVESERAEYGLTITRLSDESTAETQPAASAATSTASSQFVRVDVSRLDDLMQLISDLVISRARLADSLSKVAPYVPAVEWRSVHDNSVIVDRKLRELRNGVMRVRLVRVGEIFRRMPFVVRDLARESGRDVRLEIVGQETEIDKFVVERLMDPILHLVRNAVSHAIEPPAERVLLGKPPQGTITLSASSVGDMVALQISDDGRGVDADEVIRRAHAARIDVPAGDVEAATLLSIICTPGFSTRDSADRASGRGVGMAVVHMTVQELGGRLSMTTTPGKGTQFTLEVPLTLLITDAILTRVGTQTFAVPQAAIREVIEVQHEDVRQVERHELAPYRNGALPIVRLSHVFGLPGRPGRSLHVFVVGRGIKAVGLAVDRILGQREVVVRAMNHPMVKVPGVAGATDLGDGRAVLILDPARIVAVAQGNEMRA
jgi:two-component system chemotaxis sensor kinase CheA